MGNYNFIDHTADIAIRIEADSIEDLFITAHSAYLDAVGKFAHDENLITEKTKLQNSSDELEYLLVEFLSEINYLLLVKKRICINVSSINIRNNKNEFMLEAIMNIRKLSSHKDSIIEEIKAVTYHNIKIVENDNKLRVDIIFDI